MSDTQQTSPVDDLVDLLPYACMWFIGAIETYNILASRLSDKLLERYPDQIAHLSLLVSGAGVVTLLHMAFVYMSFREILRHLDVWKTQFPYWVGTSSDKVLRIVIQIILLLVAAAGGKYRSLAGAKGVDQAASADTVVIVLALLFACLFVILLVWDLGSWGFFRRKQGANGTAAIKVRFPELDLKNKLEALQFMVADAFGLLYWLIAACVLWSIGAVDFIIDLTATLGVIYIVIMLLRLCRCVNYRGRIIPDQGSVPIIGKGTI